MLHDVHLDDTTQIADFSATIRDAFGLRDVFTADMTVFDVNNNYTVSSSPLAKVDENGTVRWQWNYSNAGVSSGNFILNLIITDRGGNQWVANLAFELAIPLPTSDEGIGHIKLLLITGTVGMGCLIGIVAGGTEFGKYRFLILLVVPLFTKLSKNELLDQFNRGQIFGYIKSNPGANYNLIMNELGIGNGTLSYHLHMLERQGLIKSRSAGRYKIFYPSGTPVPKDYPARISKLQDRILSVVKSQEGITQHEIIELIGGTQQTISYNLKRLRKLGMLKEERKGRVVRYYPKQETS
jgi:DNA-binding MarR family transcriptional regulator